MGNQAKLRAERKLLRDAIGRKTTEELELMQSDMELMNLAYEPDASGIPPLTRSITAIVRQMSVNEALKWQREIKGMGVARWLDGLSREIGRSGAIVTYLALWQVCMCGPELYARMNPAGNETPFSY